MDDMRFDRYLACILQDICMAQEAANKYTRGLAEEYRDDARSYSMAIPNARIEDLELDLNCKLIPLSGPEEKLNLQQAEFRTLLKQLLHACFHGVTRVLLEEIGTRNEGQSTFFSDRKAFEENLQREDMKKRIVGQLEGSVLSRKNNFLNTRKNNLLDIGAFGKEIARSFLQLLDATEAGKYLADKELRKKLCSKWEGIVSQQMDTYGCSLLSTVALENASILKVQDSNSESGVINNLRFKVKMDSYQWQVSGIEKGAGSVEMVLVKT